MPLFLFFLQNQVPIGQFIQNLINSPAFWSGLMTLIVTLIGALYRSEQKRQHAELINLLQNFEKRILIEADKRYEPKRAVQLIRGEL